MRTTAETFFEYLDAPLRRRSRLLLVLLVVPLLLSFAFPLWRISMKAPQYPDGLRMDIYSHQLVGGNDGHDVREINTLNHYIGMRTITRDELRDLDWLPFGLAALALLALRAAAIGNVRSLIDLSMTAGFVSVIAFGRFVWVLWNYGHNLDPTAPVDIEPFMPVVIGSKRIANFTTYSMPQLGSVLLGAFTAGIWGITLLHLWRGRREAHDAARVVAPA